MRCDIPRTFMPLLNCKDFLMTNWGSLVTLATNPSIVVALIFSSTTTSTFFVTVWICNIPKKKWYWWSAELILNQKRYLLLTCVCQTEMVSTRVCFHAVPQIGTVLSEYLNSSLKITIQTPLPSFSLTWYYTKYNTLLHQVIYVMTNTESLSRWVLFLETRLLILLLSW